MIVVLSPHTDDAVFSIGSHLASLDDDITIVSPMAGVPDDPAGQAKHTTLRAEHAAAMELMGWQFVSGDFLDDVYPRTPSLDVFVGAFLHGYMAAADTVYIPLGIHHPDHVLVSDAAIGALCAARPRPNRTARFYEELPYRDLYPKLKRDRLVPSHLHLVKAEPSPIKEAAVRCYASQIDDELVAKLMVTEHIWAAP
jgi:LmbE family N-acetylglucosaminyl deacetylase